MNLLNDSDNSSDIDFVVKRNETTRGRQRRKLGDKKENEDKLFIEELLLFVHTNLTKQKT